MIYGRSVEIADLKKAKANLVVANTAMGSKTTNASVAVAGVLAPPVTLAAAQAAALSRKAVDRRRYLAGFVAGCVSRTCTAPIDRLKVLRQTAVPEIAGRNMFHCFKVMIADGGLRALWRGNGVNVLKNGPETALRFGFHGRLKDVLFPGAKDLQPSQRFLVASLAGAGSLTMTYPLEVMKTRMALRRTGDPKSIVRCLRTIFQQGGFRSFYRGYTISMLSYVPYSGLELSFYELFKRSYMEHFHNYHPGDPMPHLSAPAAIALIVCSSFLPMLVVYPANLLRTRFQASTCSKPMPILGTARAIYRADGALGLYRGFFTSLSKTLPSVTISYLTFEFVMELMHLPTLGSR